MDLRRAEEMIIQARTGRTDASAPSRSNRPRTLHTMMVLSAAAHNASEATGAFTRQINALGPSSNHEQRKERTLLRKAKKKIRKRKKK